MTWSYYFALCKATPEISGDCGVPVSIKLIESTSGRKNHTNSDVNVDLILFLEQGTFVTGGYSETRTEFTLKWLRDNMTVLYCHDIP